MNNRLKECFCLVLGMAVLLMTGLNIRKSTAQLADKSKILVVVPHEDDDINMAGSVIATAVAKGKQVYVLFATNGDFTFKGATRIKEALAGLSLLGVKKKNVFFSVMEIILIIVLKSTFFIPGTRLLKRLPVIRRLMERRTFLIFVS